MRRLMACGRGSVYSAAEARERVQMIRAVSMTLLALLLAAPVVAPPVAPVALVAHAAEQPKKRIAITFDDIPRAPGAWLTPDERAAKLIAILKAKGVPQAVFFINPGRVNIGDGDQARILRYAAAGHLLANHSFSHPRLSKVSAESYLADIDQATERLKALPNYRPWFRFPFLDEGGTDKAKRDAVRAGLAARGLMNGYVTVDGSDWNMEALTADAVKAGRKVDKKALRNLYVETHLESANFTDALSTRTLGRPVAQVLLLHETDLAALFLGDLIDALKKDGWEIIGAGEAFADPIHAMLPDVKHASGTRIEAIAWEKGVTGKRWYERNQIDLANRLYRERVLHEGKPE